MQTSETEEGQKKSLWEKLPFPFGQGSWWVDGTTHMLELYGEDPKIWRTAIIDEFDHHGFDRQVFIVAALGFLTDSYALFATNIVLPGMAYIYWHSETSGNNELAVNLVTLFGNMLGQLIFGFYADKLGRRKLYGLELVIVIFGTLGMVQASTGVNNNMSFLGWIILYRFVLGIGIGAEYPLSAVITAEFADKRARAKMMAAVFGMQPLAQLLAAAVGWAALAGIMGSRGLNDLDPTELESRREEIRSAVDSIWRAVVAVGAFPALIAILWRFSIPESPRYTMDVDRDVQRALADIRRHHKDENLRPARGTPRGALTNNSANANSAGNSTGINPLNQRATRRGTANNPVSSTAQNPSEEYTPKLSFYSYLFEEGNIRYLFATAFCWFLLDFAFFGLGINSPRQLGQIWASDPAANTTLPYWENPFDTNTALYWQLFDSAKEYILTICLGSLTGSICLYMMIDYIPRKTFLMCSFLALSVLFIITAILLATVEFKRGHWAAVVFYAFQQFIFNFGPNTLTFIIPAEIFPTEFRCRCHGISAAAGKLGAIIVQIILWKMHSRHLAIIIGVFSIPMALGALSLGSGYRSYKRLPNKGLEILAKGYRYANNTDTSIDPATGEPGGEAQGLGFRQKIPSLVDWAWSKFSNGGFSTRNARAEESIHNMVSVSVPDARLNLERGAEVVRPAPERAYASGANTSEAPL